MSVLENLRSKIDELQSITSYIEDLEKRANDATQNLTDVKFFEIDCSKPKIITKLYRPIRHYSLGSKCNKCDNLGFIKKNNDFYNEFDVCECQKYSIDLVVSEVDICELYEDDDTVCYVYYDYSNRHIILSKFVHDNFDIYYLDLNLDSVYFTNREDCVKYCDNYNKRWSAENDKQ